MFISVSRCFLFRPYWHIRCLQKKTPPFVTRVDNFRHSLKRDQDTRPPGHIGRQSERLEQLNYKLTVNEEKCEANVIHPGLSYDDFDNRTERPRLWKMMRLMEGARFYSHHVPLDSTGRTFRDYAQLTDDRITFLVAAELDFYSEFYDFRIIKNPLRINVQGGYIGKTSLNSITKVFTNSGNLICRNINQVVSVNKSTRRPLPLPVWWVNKYAESAIGKEPIKFEKEEKPPNGTESFQIQVVWSDTDANDHTNWSSYVRFILDTAYYVSSRRTVPYLQAMVENGVKRLELLYTGESFEGDVLTIHTWLCTKRTSRVIFHVNKGDEFICQCSVDYFEKPLLTTRK
ncbi:hypothetical protein ACJMK2_021400 [Sinanodonta woodiana]|uniref:Acyl-ACP thioesterase n=1 Tax=Sinanodonta woodiana TaxID=1069815 RepID=A0ABD3TFZ8_SINWO